MKIEFRRSKTGESVFIGETLVAEIFWPLKQSGDYWCRRVSNAQMVRGLSRDEARAQIAKWFGSVHEANASLHALPSSSERPPRPKPVLPPSEPSVHQPAQTEAARVVRIRLSPEALADAARVPAIHVRTDPPSRGQGNAASRLDVSHISLRNVTIKCSECGAATSKPRKHVSKCHPDKPLLAELLQNPQVERLHQLNSTARKIKSAVKGRRSQTRAEPQQRAHGTARQITSPQAHHTGAPTAQSVGVSIVQPLHPTLRTLPDAPGWVVCTGCGCKLARKRAASHVARRCPARVSHDGSGAAESSSRTKSAPRPLLDPPERRPDSRAVVQSEHDATLLYAQRYREGGRFGSHASHDGYGEDDAP